MSRLKHSKCATRNYQEDYYKDRISYYHDYGIELERKGDVPSHFSRSIILTYKLK